jgi:hypothetical protein
LIPFKEAARRPNDISLVINNLLVQVFASWKKLAHFRKKNAYKKKKTARTIWRPGKFLPPVGPLPAVLAESQKLKN